MSLSSAPRIIATTSLVALVALGCVDRAESHGGAIAATFRRPVALQLYIDTGYYRDKLNDLACATACRDLHGSLVEAVRDTLEVKFPFLEWNGAGAVDTVVLTWRNGTPAGVRSSQLFVQLRGSAASDSSALAVAFESRTDFRNRDEDAWKPESLRVAWLKRLPMALAEKDLLPRVIGRVPLPVAVVPLPPKRVLISTNPDSIFAAEDVPPMFELPVHVDYPRDGISENARVPLTSCNVSGKKGYSCLVEEMRFARTTRKEMALDSVLRFGTLTWKSPRVTLFVPRPRGPRPGQNLVLP